ncbi:MAG TPA: glycine oxidase ThiO [Streptosporangiaceae bacterium]|nr:glycine oxidase ThiO [Streptosporangiaceae bacterium]
MPAKGAHTVTSVVIVGGGVIGLSVGWRAAGHGLAVTVLDPRPASGASHASAGMLTPAAEAAYAERDLFTLGIESMARWPGFAAELTALTGQETGLRREGTMQVAYDSSDQAVLAEMQALRESFGAPGQWLTGREARAQEPLLAPGVRSALLTPDDGSVDPRLVTRALLAALDRCGATVIRRQVAEISASNDRVSGVLLADGSQLEADWVVLAAGAYSPMVAGLPAGSAPPVRPVKGQILRLRATPSTGLVRRTISAVVRGARVYLVPRDSGELVVGATQEEVGHDTQVTAGGVWQLLRDAQAVVPSITELSFGEACAGLRPGTPDNEPVLGPSELPGLVLATGHFRTGVLLAPVTAEIVAGFLATKHLSPLATPFMPGRFAGLASS